MQQQGGTPASFAGVPPHFISARNCSVSSQLQAKVHAEPPLAMGFCLTAERFRTVSAAKAQTC